MDNDLDIANAVSVEVFGELPSEPPWLVGQGLVNRVLGLRVHSKDYAIRYSTAYEKGAWNTGVSIVVASIRLEYEREAWCIQQATKVGIPGPQVVGSGTIGDRIVYTVQTLEKGEKGEKVLPDGQTRIWKELGRYARLIHGIPIGGVSRDAYFARRGAESWSRFIDYNIACLNDSDPLIDLGVYAIIEQPSIRKLFAQLREEQFKYGLCHNDLKPRNTIVGANEQVALLDWGSADLHLVPHLDLAEMLRWQDPAGANIQAFISGYGMLGEEFAELLPQVERVQMILAFDLVRWALDRQPARIDAMVTRAKQAVRRNTYDAPWERDEEKWEAEQPTVG